jgi:hypothetical protein
VLLVGLANRHDQQDRLREQPPGDHSQHLAGGLIQPVRVVDQADQRLLGGNLGHQAEHCQPNQEPVRCRTARQAQGHPQRLLLVLGYRLHLAEQRPAELVQGRERQLQLGLDPGDLDGAAAGGPVRDVAQERCLADPCLTAQDQHRTLATADPA